MAQGDLDYCIHNLALYSKIAHFVCLDFLISEI